MKRFALLALWTACGALVGFAASSAAADAPLGRLFFTPSQRSSLDIARQQRARTTVATENSEDAQTAAPVPQSITYDGAVRRSDGQSTVWINRRPVRDKDPAGSAVVVGRVRQDGSVSLQIPQSGRSVELKPGQSVELLSGTIEESYARKPPPAPEAKPESKPAAKGAPEARAEKPPAEAEREREAAAAAAKTSTAQSAGAAAPR